MRLSNARKDRGNNPYIQISNIQELNYDDDIDELNDNEDSFNQPNLLLDLEAKWNQIDLITNEKKNQKQSSLLNQLEYCNSSNKQVISSNDFEAILSNLIHPQDDSFEVYAKNKIRELGQLKTESLGHHQKLNNAIGRHSDLSNDNNSTYKRDPSEIVNDNSKLEKKLKSVFALIAPLSCDSDNTENKKTSKPSKKTFLKENEDKQQKLKGEAKATINNNNSHYQTKTSAHKDNNNSIKHKVKRTLGEEDNNNTIKNKIKQNSMLLKQLFSIN